MEWKQPTAFRLDLRSVQQEETHAWYCKSGQESKAKNVYALVYHYFILLIYFCIYRLDQLSIPIREASFCSGWCLTICQSATSTCGLSPPNGRFHIPCPPPPHKRIREQEKRRVNKIVRLRSLHTPEKQCLLGMKCYCNYKLTAAVETYIRPAKIKPVIIPAWINKGLTEYTPG